jgi:O-antigen/teichoic acid export membrane protein
MVMRKLNNAVLFPLYSRASPRENRQNYLNIAKARWWIMGTVLAMLAVFAIFGNYLIIALYDPRYEAAGMLVVFISIASMALVVTGGYEFAVLASGNSRRYATILVASAFFLTGSLFALISFFGIIGAVLSPLVSTFLFYPFLISLLRPYNAWIPKQDMIFCTFACISAVVALWVNFDSLQMAMNLFGVSISLTTN